MESILIDHFLLGLHGTWIATCHSWHAQCEICAAKIPNNLGWVLFDWYDSCVNTGTWIKKQVLCSKQLASKTVDNEGLTNKVIVEWPANTCIVFTSDAAVTRREIGIAADRDKTHFCWIPCKYNCRSCWRWRTGTGTLCSISLNQTTRSNQGEEVRAINK